MTAFHRCASWPALAEQGKTNAPFHLRDLFKNDPARAANFTAEAGALRFDYSRARIRLEDHALLLKLVEESGFAEARQQLFAGGIVNPSEKRPALHTALRRSDSTPLMVNGKDVMKDIAAERHRALAFAEKLRAREIRGIRQIIHVGIGGSDLGPRLLADALADGQGPAVYFIANADPAPLQELMDLLDPAETLVFLASKTFATAEVLQNGKTLRAWLEKALGSRAKHHLAATTAAPEVAKAFGVPFEQIFLLWDWVGGRFSVSSAVSLSAMAAIGAKRFEEFLRGMEAMDRHFETALGEKNIPVLLALLALWNVNVLGLPARAVLPYAERLSLWPSYLQQLEMESLGKSVDKDGNKIQHATAPVVFGASGTPAQHAFMQALHQGTVMADTEILILADNDGLKEHHQLLQAHAVAQAEALAFGKTQEDAHKNFPGNRPSSLLVLDRLSPEALGNLIALYEHKVFTLGHLWNLNPFDQWGVELGKQLAGPYQAYLAGGTEPAACPKILRDLKG